MLLLVSQNIRIVNNERFILLRNDEIFSGASKKFEAIVIPIIIAKKPMGLSIESRNESLISFSENLKKSEIFFLIIFFIIPLNKINVKSIKIEIQKLDIDIPKKKIF